MPRSGYSALHGVNPNFFFKKLVFDVSVFIKDKLNLE